MARMIRCDACGEIVEAMDGHYADIVVESMLLWPEQNRHAEPQHICHKCLRPFEKIRDKRAAITKAMLSALSHIQPTAATIEKDEF
jgi:hypothetical protein